MNFRFRLAGAKPVRALRAERLVRDWLLRMFRTGVIGGKDEGPAVIRQAWELGEIVKSSHKNPMG
jgi:hypothetical protein